MGHFTNKTRSISHPSQIKPKKNKKYNNNDETKHGVLKNTSKIKQKYREGGGKAPYFYKGISRNRETGA